MSNLKNSLLGSCAFESNCAQLVYAAFRIFTGAGLAVHGFTNKLPPDPGFVGMLGEKLGMPAPTLMAWLAGIGEAVCGLLIAVGLLTRPAAIWAGLTLVVAAGAHLIGPLPGGFTAAEKALLYVFSLALISALAGGKFSLDSAFGIGRKR